MAMPVPPIPALIKMGLGHVVDPQGPQPDSSEKFLNDRLARMGPPPRAGGHGDPSKGGLNWNQETPDEGEGSEQNGRTVHRHQTVDATRRTQLPPSEFELFVASRSDLNDEERAELMKDLMEEWEATKERDRRLEAKSREADSAEKIKRQNRGQEAEKRRAMWKRMMEEGSDGGEAARNAPRHTKSAATTPDQPAPRAPRNRCIS